MESSSGAVRSRAEVPFNVPEAVVANRPVLDQVGGSSQAHQPSEPPPLQIVKGQNTAAHRSHRRQPPPLSQTEATSVVVVPKMATTVVSRGDSLWRISRVTYGNGMRYAVIYEANQHQIRNPNRIYPGQIFVLPKQER